jgi:hypothetical protein
MEKCEVPNVGEILNESAAYTYLIKLFFIVLSVRRDFPTAKFTLKSTSHVLKRTGIFGKTLKPVGYV